ncbi:MAG: hypothetical protein AAF384_04520 [Pseudomonadota bacterium]
MLLVLLTATTGAAADNERPASFLQMTSVLDGKCQILSDGGKLRVLKNVHEERAVKYRLERVFVGKPQGLAVGVAPPQGATIKLGCTRVDGREQEWRLVRAEFIEVNEQ